MEKGKKEDIQKDGVKYIIAQGYKKVSAKTFISDIELEHFLNKDFANINKTRALGFIQILQREYDVDLTELKDTYLEHERTSRKKEPETLFIETPMKNGKEWQKFLPHLAIVLVFMGLIFFFWNNQNETSIKSFSLPSEENKSIIKEAEKNIEKLEANKSQKKVSSDVDKIESVISDDNQSFDDDLEEVVLKLIKDRNLSTDIQIQDDNKSSELNTVTKPVQLEEKIVTPPKEIILEPKEVTRGKLYIIPVQKAWVGIIYLDDFTKKDFLIRSRLPLDASRDQLIIVGHKYFKIYNKTYSVKFMGKGPVRFIYRDGELMEISKKEFSETSAGVAW